VSKRDGGAGRAVKPGPGGGVWVPMALILTRGRVIP
jgi:hypothetical protein